MLSVSPILGPEHAHGFRDFSYSLAYIRLEKYEKIRMIK